MTKSKLFASVVAGLSVLPVLWACSRDSETTAIEASAACGVASGGLTVEVPVAAAWINSGVRLCRGFQFTLNASPDSNPKGSPKASRYAPVRTFGTDGLIGRFGLDGVPFPVGEHAVIQGSSLHENDNLYLGRNIPLQNDYEVPATGAVTDSTDADITDSTIVIEPEYAPQLYAVRVEAARSDSPALLSPIDGFYGSSGNPFFVWDQQDNATQYNLEISRYRDFREDIFNVTINSTSINTAIPIGVDLNNPGNLTQNQPNLSEGVYFWRVRAQINKGRALSPIFVWTERSAPFRIGVETQTQSAPAPERINPPDGAIPSPGAALSFEFLTDPESSGLWWRYRIYQAACNTTIDPNASSTVPAVESVWRVFQSTLVTNILNEPEKNYGFFRTPQLSQGEWLVRIETRDGLDENLARLGLDSFRASVGCD